MQRILGLGLVLVGLVGGGCGGGPSCALPDQWSSARTGDGSLCQVNIFTVPARAVYCGGMTGRWDCACGPLAENPQQFISEDLCDLEPEERVCQAIARCGFAP